MLAPAAALAAAALAAAAARSVDSTARSQALLLLLLLLLLSSGEEQEEEEEEWGKIHAPMPLLGTSFSETPHPPSSASRPAGRSARRCGTGGAVAAAALRRGGSCSGSERGSSAFGGEEAGCGRRRTPAYARASRRTVLSLSMDPFGFTRITS
jgi:hypothetical protein